MTRARDLEAPEAPEAPEGCTIYTWVCACPKGPKPWDRNGVKGLGDRMMYFALQLPAVVDDSPDVAYVNGPWGPVSSWEMSHGKLGGPYPDLGDALIALTRWGRP